MLLHKSLLTMLLKMYLQSGLTQSPERETNEIRMSEQVQQCPANTNVTQVGLRVVTRSSDVLHSPHVGRQLLRTGRRNPARNSGVFSFHVLFHRCVMNNRQVVAVSQYNRSFCLFIIHFNCQTTTSSLHFKLFSTLNRSTKLSKPVH